MNIIPINNYISYNKQPYKTSVVKNVSFNSLFSKSLQDKFNDGIAALDGHSVFIFTAKENAENTEFNFNTISEKINIPIIKTYTLVASEKDIPSNTYDTSFAVYKKGDTYYIADLNGIGGGLQVGKNVEHFEKENRLSTNEIRELKNGDKIVIYKKLFENNKDIFLKFTPVEYNPKAAEKYMKVYDRFSDENVISNFNKTIISAVSKDNKKTSSTERKYTFADIGGLEDQKEELRKYVIRPINYPKVYENIRLNKGILLYGPPRCGKTLLGKALANEANVRYKYCNANEFISSEVGSSEENVRMSFDELMSAPTIMFIDEFDSIGKTRDGSSNARYDDSVVNQILGCMSDLEKSHMNSFVIAATNRIDLIDEALLATGRFGLHLEIPMPNEKELGAIYDIYAKNQSFDSDVSEQEIVSSMFENKFNGSDVAEIISIGYMNALERLGMNRLMDAKQFRFKDLKRIKISKEDLQNAIKKISSQKILIKK